MAEAPKISDQDPGTKAKYEFSITDCSICLEKLRNPKSLPCLHTFCQDCLSTFITSQGGSEAAPIYFNCPVCRRKALPIEPSSVHDQWASQFPTNNFVIEMMRKINPDDTSKHLCHPCLKRRNQETSASCWCQDCGYFLCADCIQSHDSVIFCHHAITLEELSQRPVALIPTKPLCEKHGEKQNLICTDHEVLGCHTCVAIDHRKCDNVSTVTEYAESLKSKDKLAELAQDIDKNVGNIDNIITEFRGKLDTVTTDKEKALQRLSDVRKWFDAQMSRMSEEVMKTFKVEAEKIKKIIEDMETIRSSLLQTKAMSDTTQQTGQEHQLVSTVLRGKSEMERCEQIIQGKPVAQVRIHVKLKYDFEKMTEKQDIGTVEVLKQNMDIDKRQTSKPLFGRVAKQVGSITVPGHGSYIYGMLVLHTGHLIVSDHSSNQLLYINESGNILSSLKLNGGPFDICEMPDGHIAVSVYNSKQMIIVRLSSTELSLIKNIPLHDNPCGVKYFDGALHITLPNQLQRVSESGQLQQVKKFSNTSYYLTCNNSKSHLIGSFGSTDSTHAAVYQVSGDNTYTEIMKADVVKGARGIDVDDEDNMYVCGMVSHNVLQISADGSRTREILTQYDVVKPLVINVSGEKVYVCEYGKRTIRIFKLE